jgi:hypothetical protein
MTTTMKASEIAEKPTRDDRKRGWATGGERSKHHPFPLFSRKVLANWGVCQFQLLCKDKLQLPASIRIPMPFSSQQAGPKVQTILVL